MSGTRVACLPGVPVILLRRPDIQQLFGLGDVLEYLENTRTIQCASGRDHVAVPVTHTTRAPDAEPLQAGPSNVKAEPAERAGAIATSAVTRGYNAPAGQAGSSTWTARSKVEPSVRGVQGQGKIDKGKARDMGIDWRQDVQRVGFRVVVENGEEVIEI